MSDPNVAFAFPFPSLKQIHQEVFATVFPCQTLSVDVCKLAQTTNKSQEVLGMDVTPLRVKKRVRTCPY